MALYTVEIFTRRKGDEDKPLLAIAGIVGKPVQELRVDRTKLSLGTVSVVVEGDLDVVRNIRVLGCTTVKQIRRY